VEKKTPARRASPRATSPAPVKTVEKKTPARKASPRSESPMPAKTAEKKIPARRATSRGKSPSSTKSKMKQALPPVPVEDHSPSYRRSATSAIQASSKKVKKTSPAKSIDFMMKSGIYALSYKNPDNSTAIDDEQLIEFSFRTGVLDQWGKVVATMGSFIGPLFICIALIYHFMGGTENARIGVIYCVLLVFIMALTIACSLPAIMVQRIFVSLFTGKSPSKSKELELLCLILTIVSISSLYMCYHLIST
jgi:hypothetical protein